MPEPAWIEIVPEEKASGKLKRAYEKVRADHGQNLNIARASSLWPELIEAQEREYSLFSKTKTYLDDDIKDLIGALVAQVNHSEYYSNYYRSSLIERGWTDEKVTHILQDIKSTHLDSKGRAFLVFADKLTRHPQSMSSSDINELRSAGIDDRGILEVAALASYHNYLVRVANALGVEDD